MFINVVNYFIRLMKLFVFAYASMELTGHCLLRDGRIKGSCDRDVGKNETDFDLGIGDLGIEELPCLV